MRGPERPALQSSGTSVPLVNTIVFCLGPYIDCLQLPNFAAKDVPYVGSYVAFSERDESLVFLVHTD